MEVKREVIRLHGNVHMIGVSILVLMEVKRERIARLEERRFDQLFQSLF